MRLFPSTEQARAGRLSRLDRFAGMTQADVHKVVKAATMTRLGRDEVVALQGSRADGAYVVISGQLSVTQDGNEIATLRAGDIIGEIGMVAGYLRTATVTALVESEALHFPPDVASQLYDEVPAFQPALEETAEKRLSRDWYTE